MTWTNLEKLCSPNPNLTLTTMRSEPLLIVILIVLLISGAPSNTLAGIRQGFGG